MRDNVLLDTQMNSKFKLRPQSRDNPFAVMKVDRPKPYAWYSEPNPDKVGIPDNLYTDGDFNHKHPAPAPIVPVQPAPSSSTSKVDE